MGGYGRLNQRTGYLYGFCSCRRPIQAKAPALPFRCPGLVMTALILLLAAPGLAILLLAGVALGNRRARAGAKLAAASAAHRHIKRRQMPDVDR